MMKFALGFSIEFCLVNAKYLKKLLFAIYSIALISGELFGQDVHFTQLSQTQFFSNPAFTGIQFGPRILLHYRNQYPRVGFIVNSGFKTYYASYDQFLDPINSGLGVQLMADKYGDDIYTKYQASIHYAYQVRIDEEQAFRVGLSGSIILQQLDGFKLRFFDQIDPIYGFDNYISTQEKQLDNYSQTYYNVSAGALYYRNNFYAGLSCRNLLPKKNFYNPSRRAFEDMTVSGQLGAVFWLNPDTRSGIFPYILYDREYGFHKIVGNLIYQYQMVNMGAGARYNESGIESVMLLLGINWGKTRLSYSYDIPTSALSSYSGGAHEIGLRFLFNGEDNSLRPNEYKNILFCPDFMKN